MTLLLQPVIILVDPQMGENIGMSARAMLNCGLTELRVVNPRDGWPNDRAVSASADALEIMPPVAVFDTLGPAIADLNFVYATSGRLRHMVKPVYTGAAAAIDMRDRIGSGQRVGIIFGAERTGLLNDQLAMANAILNFPTNPDFASLNLSQAVLLVAYEWLRLHDTTEPRRYETQESPPATNADMTYLLQRLENELADRGFFASPDMRPSVMRNITNYLRRAEMSTQDVQTFQGMISVLMGSKIKK
jgi:tRNA/rRNA methyltransferase